MLFSWKNPLKALPVLLLLAVHAGAAFGAAGNVQFVIGDAKLISAGTTRALQKGDAINEGDRVITAANASAQIKMVDGGFIAIRPNTDMGFDTYRYQGKEDGSESAIVSLLRGGFRTITGVIGRTNKQNYLIKTATATIGIRGTDHEPMVILPPAPGQVAIAEAGTYDKVNVGVAFIRTDAGSIDIQSNQVGFAPVTKAAPVILPRIPPFYKPTPAPGPQQATDEKKEEGKTETAAAGSGETAAEAPAEIRETAVVDPATAVAAGSTETTTASAPATTEAVVPITLTDASGTTVNATTQTATTSTGVTTPIAEAPTEPVQPPPAPTVINPVVAATNYDFAVLALKPVTGGAERIETSANSPVSANTNFVLDGNQNLVEILNSRYRRFGINYDGQTQIASADVKLSGGVAADTASDPNGTYYLGRWAGGQIDVKDLATTSPVAPFTDLLGPRSAHWIIGLAPAGVSGPPAVNAVQKVVGSSSYTLATATHPTDSLGNVGTLNSAFLDVDFSAQTVSADLNLSFSSTDAANPSTRNMNFSAFGTNMPIAGAGFDAHGKVSVNCSGTDCATVGYQGDMGGTFLSTVSGGAATGAVGTGAAIGYGISPADVPSPGTNAPYSDLIQGVAVLSTSAAPPTGILMPSSAVLRDEVLWPTTQIATGANPTVTTYIVSDKLTGLTASSNFLFDASGNLVRVFDTPHVVYDLATAVPGSTTQFAAPTPLAHAQLSFGGNGATSENYYDPGTGVRFGRWNGGVVNVLDLATGNSYIESLLAPNGASRSLQWVVAQTPSSLPTTGVFHYTRILDGSGAPSFATAPTDSYGNVGTLEGARLSADFTNMTASAGLRITMPSGPAGSLGIQNLGARFDNAPISGGGFNVSSSSSGNPVGTDNLHLSCVGAGCAPNITTSSGVVSAYGGRFRGGFDSATGNAGTADGAFLRYTFNTLYSAYGVTPPTGRVVDDYINGLVAFGQGPQIKIPTSAAYPVAAPAAPISVVATYGYSDVLGSRAGGNAYFLDKPAGGGLVTDSAGNLVSLTEDPASIWGDNQALALSGGTANPATPIALAIGSASSASDGSILLGWQSASPSLTVSGIDYEGCFGTSGCLAPARPVLADGLSWVRGPAPFPAYLPGAISGYSNSTGVVIPGSATYNLGASILHDQSGNPGTVNSAGLTVNFGRANVAFNMDATTSAGNWLVSATGIRLDQGGAFNAHAGASGATIISGTSVAPTSTHENMSLTLNGSTNTSGNIEGQLMGIGVGGAGVTYNLNSTSLTSASASGALAFGLSGSPYSALTPYHMALYTVGMTGAGEFDSGENTRIDGGFLSSYRTQMVDNFPVKMDGALPVVVVNGGTFTNDMQVVYTTAGATPVTGVVDSIGTATLLQSGYDLATGIRWGRYGGGTVGVNDRINGQNLGTLDITNQNAHLLISSNQSGPTVLPITGTFNYAFVGGTSPTDSNGNIGAALTAANASLSANFATQTVDATLSNLSVGGNTWGASATGIPIQNNIFQAEKKLGGGGNLSVTSSLGTDTAGRLIGGFTGQTGNGAGLAYSLNHGGNKNLSNPAAVTVSGVAVFKR
jgi:hypothetical protein